MIGRQKRLHEVYEHLRSNFGVHTQTDFAESLKYSRVYISAAMNGNEKNLTDKLFTKICEAYPGVFNLDYLLDGEGGLLLSDSAPMMEQPPTVGNPLAEVIEAKNETISTQNKTIESLQQQIVIQNKLIATLQREIDRLKANEFSLVVADKPEPDK